MMFDHHCYVYINGMQIQDRECENVKHLLMLWLFVGFFNGNFKSDYFAQVCRFEDWCKSCYLLINADKGKRLALNYTGSKNRFFTFWSVCGSQ